MERETIEVVLPLSQARFILYTYLTFGEQRKVKRVSFDAMQMKIDKVDPKNKTADFQIKDISASFQLDASDLTVKLLTKEVFDKDGQKVADVWAFIENLQQADGDLLYDKVDELTQKSVLSEEDKKK